MGRMNLTFFLVVFCMVIAASSSTEEAGIVFIGLPKVKTEMNGLFNSGLVRLSETKAKEVMCVISLKNGKYYWKSRDDHEIEGKVHGSYLDFARPDRPDYVRIVIPHLKSQVALEDFSAKEFDYVEHLTINLSQVTYFGTTVYFGH